MYSVIGQIAFFFFIVVDNKILISSLCDKTILQAFSVTPMYCVPLKMSPGQTEGKRFFTTRNFFLSCRSSFDFVHISDGKQLFYAQYFGTTGKLAKDYWLTVKIFKCCHVDGPSFRQRELTTVCCSISQTTH